jgi:hypothetical protein
MYRDLVYADGAQYTVVSTVNLPKVDKDAFKDGLTKGAPNLGSGGAQFAGPRPCEHRECKDLNFILMLSCSEWCFVILLLTYGRIELAIDHLSAHGGQLGVDHGASAGFSGIKFNMVNVLITTFIFGLGDDYSIFNSDAHTEPL